MDKGLFRGKTTDGKWVYGAYVAYNWHPTVEDGDTEITGVVVEESNIIDYEDECLWNLVIPGTVGQYTGLTDKNGKKIFEGDIVAIDHTRRTTFWDEIPETYKPRNSYSVQWDEKKDEINYKRNYAVEWKEKDARWILRNGSDQHDLRDVFIHFHNGIVIGNIHDNPELLKGGEG